MEPFVMQGGTIGSEIKVWRDMVPDLSEEALDRDAKLSLIHIYGVDGIWKCTAAQSPIGIGQKSAEVAYKILNGESYESEIKIPSFAVTPENIDQYNKSDWQ